MQIHVSTSIVDSTNKNDLLVDESGSAITHLSVVDYDRDDYIVLEMHLSPKEIKRLRSALKSALKAHQV
jgi:hypothetical protein